MLYPQITSSSALPDFTLALQGTLVELPAEPVTVAFLCGLLQMTTDRRVSIVNAQAIADELAISVHVRREESAGPFASRLRVVGGETSLAGTSSSSGPRIVELDGYEVDALPAGALVMTQHRDVPGMVGKVGTVLGEAAINISAMQVSRNSIGGDAAMVLAIDRSADEATLERLRAIDGVRSVRALQLPPQTR